MRSPSLFIVIKGLAVLALCLVGGAFLSVEKAQAQMEVKTIAVVDVQRVFAQAKAMRAARGQYRAYKVDLDKQKNKGVQDMQTEFQAHRQKKSIMDPAAWNEAGNALENRRDSFLQQLVILDRKIDVALKQTSDTFRASLLGVIGEITVAKKIDIVMNKAEVLALGSPAAEITDEVIAAVDAKLPTLKLPDPNTIGQKKQ